MEYKVISHELSETLCGLRLSNIYDLSSRIFLFKFAKPSDRKQFVVDSGFRCHLTNFTRATAAEPSAFVARLRKFLRTRRVTAVSQIGTDRVIEFQFSDGQYRLILEFFAGGNVILTDKDLNILSLLRIVPKGEKQEELRVGLRYSLEDRQNFSGVPPLTEERVREGLRKALDQVQVVGHGGKKARQKPGDTVRKALANSLNEFPPMLIEHVLRLKQFDFTRSVYDVLEDPSTFWIVLEALKAAQDLVSQVLLKEICTGYIIAESTSKEEETASASDRDHENDKENAAVMFDDFQPFLPMQVEGQAGMTVLEIEGYNATVDRFFSSLESQKLEARLQERQDHANKKLKAARDDHAARVEGLQQVQHLNVRKAQAIEGNVHWVNEACAAVNGLIAQGMDWSDIGRLIEMEQARQNPVARLIKLPLKLYENTVTLLLGEETHSDKDEDSDMSDRTDSEDSDEEESHMPLRFKEHQPKEDQRLTVDIDLALSPWANARQYYDQKKFAAVKEEKTKQSSMKALKSAEVKVKTDLHKGLKKEKEVLRPVRKQLWFEKFFYFISTEGYLVIAGRDKPQTEILYARYFQPGDAWIHTEVNGALPVIVKNKRETRAMPLPLLTLSQAGNLCVISSTAWDSKAVMGSWWVECKQVTKLDSTGQYLGQGDFIIKGEKNFLPPAQLLLGFGVMFRISSASKAEHLRHRVRSFHDEESEVQSQEQDFEIHEQVEDVEEHEGQNETLEEDINNASDHSTKISEKASDLSETEIGDKIPDYQNPLQTKGIGSTTIGSQMEELKLEKAEVVASDDDAAKSSKDDGSDSEVISAEAKMSGAVKILSGRQSSLIASDVTPSVSKAARHVRGKRGKQAKMKSKYADQDEDDRELAMQLLGSRPNAEKNKDSAEAKAAREAQSAQQKERRREQHSRAQDAGKASEEERQKLLASGQELMAPEELVELDMIDNFVGKPRPSDEILDCLVVCGPWEVMGTRLRWKTKLQPGSVKKGKAVKEILTMWTHFIADMEKRRLPPPESDNHAEVTQLRKEGEMIKTLRDVELVGMIPVGKVRLVTGGGGDKAKGGAKQGARGGKGGKKKR